MFRYLLLLIIISCTAFGQSYDAFGRLRTSGPGQRLDVEFLYDKQPDYFDELTNNGTVSHNADSRDLTLSLTNGDNGSYAHMCSYPVPYTPGNSQLIDITGVLNLSNISGGTAEVFLRSTVTGSTTEQIIEQSAWLSSYNSGDIDWSKSHIFYIDFHSLKVGTIKFGLVRQSKEEVVAFIHNDNVRNTGYWELANLPAYYKIYTESGETFMELGYGNSESAVGFRYVIPANASATMKAICCTVKSEGAAGLTDLDGLPSTANTGITSKTISTNLVPIISIRSRDTFKSLDNLVLSLPNGFSIQTDNPIRLAVVIGGTLTSASWSNVDTNLSSVEFDSSATVLTGGHILTSEYIYATSSGPSSARFTASGSRVLGKVSLWNRLGSETGILTIASIRTGGSDASCLASLNWIEIR